MNRRTAQRMGTLIAAVLSVAIITLCVLLASNMATALHTTYGTAEFHHDGDGYVTEWSWSQPCAISMTAAHVEDDVCAAWLDRDGVVHIGPLSAAPARAHMVGG